MAAVRYLFAIAFVGSLAAQDTFIPAQYRSGAVPPVPDHAVGGGDVILDVSVNRSGGVSDIKVARSTPPFTDLVSTAIRGWQFQPARGPQPVDSTVLVAAVFRPPTINTPTQGKPPTDTSTMSPEAPFPLTMVTPPYPVHAVDNRLVLVEVRVGTGGNTSDAKIIGSTSGFDDAALDAARRWTFRPAEVGGARVTSLAYLMFGFRRPVTTVH